MSGGARASSTTDAVLRGQVYLFAYAKNAQADLTAVQRKMPVQWVNEVLDDE